MELYIGIDPSINSTGICVQLYSDEDKKIYEHFYIIKPDKLTKKEQLAQNESFNYIIYNKYDLSLYKDINHQHEYYKTLNMVNLVNTLYNVILEEINRIVDDIDVYVIQEGISYGSSIRTKSVFDLSGLNYMIRYKLLENSNILNLKIVTPAELKKFTTGKGNANKDTIVSLFNLLYPALSSIPKCDDIADAYFMVTYCKHMNKYNEL